MTVDRATILSGIRDVGVTSGDVLLVHSSLRSFGYVTGGAETVIDALLESVGDGGHSTCPNSNLLNSQDLAASLLHQEDAFNVRANYGDPSPTGTGSAQPASRLFSRSHRTSSSLSDCRPSRHALRAGLTLLPSLRAWRQGRLLRRDTRQ